MKMNQVKLTKETAYCLRIIISVMIVAMVYAFYLVTPFFHSASRVVGEYQRPGISEELARHDAYTVGLNKNNKPVFKNPNAAYKQIQSECPEGFEAVSKQFKLCPINKWNCKKYEVYGWQLDTNDDELRKQGGRISYVLGIYLNSFE